MPTLAIKLRGSDEYEIDITPVTDLDAGVGYTHPVTGEYVITSRPIHAGKLGAAYRTGLFRCLKANRADVFTPGDELTFTGTGVVAGADTLTVVRPSSAGDVFVEAELNPPGTGGGGGGLSQSQVDARIKGRPVYRFGGTQGSETGKGTEVTIGEWGSTPVLNHAAEVIYVPSVGGPVTRIEHQAFDGANWQIISVDTPPSRQQPDPANLAARESATTKPNGYESFPETNKQRYVVVNGAWVWDKSYKPVLANQAALNATTEHEEGQHARLAAATLDGKQYRNTEWEWTAEDGWTVFELYPATGLQNLSAPNIESSFAVGEAATVDEGTWSETPSSYTYQWKRDGSDISGATGATYTPVASDLGKRVSVVVTASGNGSAAAESADRIVAFPGIGTMAIGSTNIVGLTDIKVVQQSASSGGLWGPMDGARIEFLGDTAILMQGWGGQAYNPDWTDAGVTNLIYRSTDFGVTWAKVRDHNFSGWPADHFPAGHTVSSLVHNVGGTDYIYQIGGGPFVLDDNVRRSSDGITWELVNTGAMPWAGKILAMAGVLNGDLYFGGGTTQNVGGSGTISLVNHTSEVWKSTDDGVTWSSLGSAPWAPRSTVDRFVHHNGNLYVIGGGVYDEAAAVQDRIFFNDVWKFDGTTWTEVLPNGHSQWDGSWYANTFSWGGWLYTYGGTNVTGNQVDTFRSKDGENWQRIQPGSLRPSHADGIGVHPTRGVLIASGNGDFTVLQNSNSPSYLLTWK